MSFGHCVFILESCLIPFYFILPFFFKDFRLYGLHDVLRQYFVVSRVDSFFIYFIIRLDIKFFFFFEEYLRLFVCLPTYNNKYLYFIFFFFFFLFSFLLRMKIIGQYLRISNKFQAFRYNFWFYYTYIHTYVCEYVYV